MKNRAEVLQKAYQLAFDNERTYTGCSQTVLAALREVFPEIGADVVRASSALAGGVARQGESCGALIGAVMAISALFGRERLEDMAQYQRAMEPAMTIHRRFEEEIGHTICAEIHKIRYGRVYDLSRPEEREVFREIGCRNLKGCPVVCGTAARLAAEAIVDMREEWVAA